MFASKKYSIIILFFSLIQSSSFAQLSISSPLNRSVFQRNANNNATIIITGSCTQNVDKIQARFITITEDATTNWQTISSNPVSGIFSGSMILKGGWYKLEVQSLSGTKVIATAQVEKVGVGEVFVIAGQSNAGAGNIYDNFRDYGLYPASDDRVNTIVFNEIDGVDNNKPDNSFNYPSLEFKQINYGTVGPRGTTPWCWGILGDSLVKRLGVPVMFFNTGWAGTSVRNWSESAMSGITQSDFGAFYSSETPYGHLKAVLNQYCSYLGIRAVLWIQGEADNFTGKLSKDSPNGTMDAYAYALRLKQIIEKSRANTGKNITWVIARTSLCPQGFTCDAPQLASQRVIDGQNAVINLANFQVFAGPATDEIQVPRAERGSCVHFTGTGFIDLANAWNIALSTSFFNSSIANTGYLPSIIPKYSNRSNQIELSFADQYSSYLWSNGATSATISAGNGVYSCKVTDSFGNSYTQAITLTLPAPLGINTNIGANNDIIIYQNPSLTGLVTLIVPENLGESTVIITDLQGRILDNFQFLGLNEPLTIDLRNKTQKAFLIKVSSANFEQTKKVILE